MEFLNVRDRVSGKVEDPIFHANPLKGFMQTDRIRPENLPSLLNGDLKQNKGLVDPNRFNCEGSSLRITC